MRETRVILALLAVAMALTIAGGFALKDAMKARPPGGPRPLARPDGTRAKTKPKYRTLGALMAANYGWKPQASHSASSRKQPQPAVPSTPAPPVRPPVSWGRDPDSAAALAKAVNDDDVCTVDRLLPKAGKEAAVAAFLEPGQSRMLSGSEEQALRSLLDPRAKAENLASGAALQGLRFLDALEQAGFLRATGALSAQGRIAPSLGQHDALEELAASDGGNGAYAFFLAPAQLAAGRDPRDVRGSVARAMRAPRLDSGLPEILELLAKQGLASASHLYLSTYLRASVPLPSWAPPLAAARRLMRNDVDLQRASYEFGERLQQEALEGFDRSPAARRWHESQLAAGNQLVAMAWASLNTGVAGRELGPEAEMPPPEPREAANAVLDAIRALGREGQECDRSPMDRAVRDERGRLRL